VIKKIHSWNKNSNCGIVFGATNLTELKENISIIDDLPLLIPGVGAQGGSLEDITSLLFSQKKYSYLINVSRGIIQKSLDENFAKAAKDELHNLNWVVSRKLQ
jgi:orotidine-5'-phosphate decarboxylase